MGFRAITAKKPNASRFRQSLNRSLQTAMKPIKKDFDTTVKTWDNKPVFPIKIETDTGEIAFGVYVISNWSPGQDATANDIYMFVSRGTSERYAVMTAGFIPKTRKGIIGSSSGKGGTKFISRKVKMPGIEAREFEETIASKHKKKIVEDTRVAFYHAAKEVGMTI